MISNTPKVPYYVVIFTSLRTNTDDNYSIAADRMIELAKQENAFLGVESAREELGITVSYWKDLEGIENWKKNTEHLIAQSMGKGKWYKAFKVRIAKVERDYAFEK